MTQKTGAHSDSRDAKRSRFASKPQRAPAASPLILVVGVAVALALIGGTIFLLSRSSAGAAKAQTSVSTQGAQQTGGAAGSQQAAPEAATAGHDPYPLAQVENGAVRLPASTFDDHQAHFYTLMVQGRPVEFFVLKDKDGVVRAAFNACDVCFPAKKGYHQEGDEMVCNNCGRRFPINQIGLIRGGCNPSPLTPTVDGSTVVIQESELANGLSLF